MDQPFLLKPEADRYIGTIERRSSKQGMRGQQFPLWPTWVLTTFTGCRSFMRRHASCLLPSPGNLAVGSQQTTESCQLTAERPFWIAQAACRVANSEYRTASSSNPGMVALFYVLIARSGVPAYCASMAGRHARA